MIRRSDFFRENVFVVDSEGHAVLPLSREVEPLGSLRRWRTNQPALTEGMTRVTMRRASRTGLISIALVAFCYGPSAEAQEPLPPCAPRGGPAGSVQASLQLTTVNGRPTTGPIELTFGDRRDGREFIIEHQVLDCVFSESEVGSQVEAQYRRPASAEGKVLSADIELTTTIQNPSLAVSVFRINPSDEQSMPGKFLTGFVVTDRRFSHFQQDINVSLRYHRTSLLFVTLVIPALVIGPLIIWAKGRAGGSTESFWGWWGRS